MTDVPAAVLFDMDGLLVDTEPLWLETETEVMARLGASWTTRDQEALLGGSMRRTVGYLLAKAARPAPPRTVERWLNEGMLGRVRAGRVLVRPGARELLAEVAGAGLPHGLVTSSQRSFAEAVLASTGITFPVTVCAEDVAVTKPDPEPYLLGAKLLRADPARCVALEDSPNGVASATAAGCRVVAVPSLVPIPPAPGRLVVPSLRDVTLGVLRDLAAGAGTGAGLPLDVPGGAPGMPRWRGAGRRDMSYNSIFWLPVAAVLTALGLFLTYRYGRAPREPGDAARRGLVAAADSRVPHRVDRDVLEDRHRDRQLCLRLRVLPGEVGRHRGGRGRRRAVLRDERAGAQEGREAAGRAAGWAEEGGGRRGARGCRRAGQAADVGAARHQHPRGRHASPRESRAGRQDRADRAGEAVRQARGRAA